MKECLIIGPTTALTYKDVYPLLIDKTLFVTERGINFITINQNLKTLWYSTLPRSVDMSRRQLTKTYNPDDYPTYDNAPDIIECANKKDIPIDYSRKIGVPVTFFCFYPELPYEILEYRRDLKLNGKNMFPRLIIRRKQL